METTMAMAKHPTYTQLSAEDLEMYVGGGTNIKKCVVGTAGGAIRGGAVGIPGGVWGIVLGAIGEGLAGAARSCW